MEVMAIWSYAFLGAAVLSTAMGQLFYKMYFSESQGRYAILSAASFVVAPLANYGALLSLEMGFVFMSASATHILVLLFSLGVLREKISTRQWVAAGMIAGGIVMYGI